MNVEGQHNPKDIECIPVESVEVLPSGADWQKGEKQRFVTESISRQNRARKRQKTTFVQQNRHRQFTTVT